VRRAAGKTAINRVRWGSATADREEVAGAATPEERALADEEVALVVAVE
jgi:hypothetical protein